MTKTKKSILVVTGLYPPEIGGPATYSKLIEEELPKLGYQVKILAFKEVRSLPKIFRHLVFLFKIISLFRKFDLVYAQDPVSVGLPAMVSGWLFNKKYLLRLGGDYAWEQGVNRFGVKDSLDEFVDNFHKYSLPVRLFKKIQTVVARRAVLVIVPSFYLAGIVEKWGINKNQIKLIPNTFTIPEVLSSRDVLRDKFKFTGPTLISVGRLVSWKGFDCLIDIIPILKQNFSDLKLVIVGDGPELDNLVKKVKKMNLESEVIFLGKLKQSVLFEYIKAADVFVLNTNYEGLSHLILEVMALRVPVLTTKIGGNLELVTDKLSGLIFPYNDTSSMIKNIETVLVDQNLRESLIDGGSKVIKNFTLDETIKTLDETLSKI